jgi:hypothetical protein
MTTILARRRRNEAHAARCSTDLPRPPKTSAAACIRRFCLECLGARSARDAFDCLSGQCPLYACVPFRGRTLPKHRRPVGGVSEEEELRQEEMARLPKHRPSKKRVAAYCRSCQPGDRSDCRAEDCPLYPYRPWPGPGHAPPPHRSERQRKAARAGLAAAARRRKPLTEGQSVS